MSMIYPLSNVISRLFRQIFHITQSWLNLSWAWLALRLSSSSLRRVVAFYECRLWLLVWQRRCRRACHLSTLTSCSCRKILKLRNKKCKKYSIYRRTKGPDDYSVLYNVRTKLIFEQKSAYNSYLHEIELNFKSNPKHFYGIMQDQIVLRPFGFVAGCDTTTKPLRVSVKFVSFLLTKHVRWRWLSEFWWRCGSRSIVSRTIEIDFVRLQVDFF